MVVANVGMPQNARSLLVSPNVAPNTGYLRVAFSDPEKRAVYDAAKRVGECHALPAFELKEFVDGIEGEQRRQVVRRRI